MPPATSRKVEAALILLVVACLFVAWTVRPDDGDLTLRPFDQPRLAAVTEAETSRDGNFVVVRTSNEAVLYKSAKLIRGDATPYLRISIDGLKEPQGEGVALDGPMLYLSSGGRSWNRVGRLLTLRCGLTPPFGPTEPKSSGPVYLPNGNATR